MYEPSTPRPAPVCVASSSAWIAASAAPSVRIAVSAVARAVISSAMFEAFACSAAVARDTSAARSATTSSMLPCSVTSAVVLKLHHLLLMFLLLVHLLLFCCCRHKHQHLSLMLLNQRSLNHCVLRMYRLLLDLLQLVLRLVLLVHHQHVCLGQYLRLNVLLFRLRLLLR